MSAEITDFPGKPRPSNLLALTTGWTGTLRRGLDVENNRAHTANFAWQIAATPARSYPEMMHKVAAARATAELYLGDYHPVTCFLNSVRNDLGALSGHPWGVIHVPDIDGLTGAGTGETD